MTAHYSRLLEPRDEWLLPLLDDHAAEVAIDVSELAGTAALTAEHTSRVTALAVVADNPRPSRGYAMPIRLEPDVDGTQLILAEVHVIAGQAAEVSRGLFSTLTQRARALGASGILVDADRLSAYTARMITNFGHDYGIEVLGGAQQAPQQPQNTEGTPTPPEGAEVPAEGAPVSTEATEITDALEQVLRDGLENGETATIEGTVADEAPEVPEDVPAEEVQEAPVEETVAIPRIKSTVEVIPVEASVLETFDCPADGCGRTFRNRAGLTSHAKTH